MTNKTITDLTAASALDGSELISITQGGNSRKLPLARFTTVDAMVASSIAYSGGDIDYAEGDIIEAGGFRYEVAASDATDEHVTTAGGVKLYELREGVGGRFEYAYISNPINGTGANLLIRNPEAGATRIHIEPNGNIDSGTVTKWDMMLDPFDDDQANYRISNWYTITGDTNGTGESGIAFIGNKNAGNHWGNWTSMHFGFQDDGESAVPMKLYLLDHSAPQHYTPHKGGWREGLSVTTGDYVTTLVAGVGRVYVAASTGTTGATVPSHASGTVSDGAVDWTFVRSVSSGSVKPVVVVGERDDMPLLGFSDVRFQLQGAALQDYSVKWSYLDAAGAEGGYVAAAQTGGTDDWIYMPFTRGGGYVRYHMDDNYMQRLGMAEAAQNTTATDGDTTPSVAGVTTLEFRNTSPTTVTALDDGVAGQRVRLVANNSNTTIKHTAATSAGLIRNATEADIVLQLDGALDLEMDKSGGFWRVVGVGY